jgi:UDP-glucose 4-epimerase
MGTTLTYPGKLDRFSPNFRSVIQISNVVDGYIHAGHEVLVADNLYTGKRSNVNPKARFFEIDIRSREMVELIKRERPDVLNHHAAQISVPDSVSDPLLDADINIKGLLNLLEGAVKADVKKIIFISSGGAIYGEALEYPTAETYLPRPLSPYAVAKYASEHYLGYYRHQYKHLRPPSDTPWGGGCYCHFYG